MLPALVAGVCLALPATSLADRKIKVERDLDGDGHYNTKTYRVRDGRNHDRRHYGRYDRGYHGGYDRGYYGSRYYGGGRGYGYPYGSRYGYSRPYDYGYYGYGPSVGLSLVSRPRTTYSTRTVYRSDYSDAQDDLAVDVQRALKRRGYYNGYVDGDIGPGSRSAIRAYQADRGLRVTGRIDRSLLRSLGVG